MVLTEFEIIRRYFTRPAPGAVLGVGDDAALARVRRGHELVVTTDMLVAGRHFRADADPGRLGHKALAVNLSDIAAMGATPRWVTMALALPRADARWLAAFAGGFLRLARRHGVDLVGGDLTRGPLNIAVQVMGEVRAGMALRRDGARAGDDLWVSGTLGDAALALAAAGGRLALSRAERARLERRLHAPAPRLALGNALRGVARSAIDVSDGLVADLGHICRRSRVGAVVHFDRVPVSPIARRFLERSATRAAVLAGGDDYELAFTAPVRRRAAIERIARRLRIRLTRIGAIVAPRRGASPVTVLDPVGAPLTLAKTGFAHF
jgi:thiamine-monophosphate kinase